MTRTFASVWANTMARLIVVVVFPSPGFALVITILLQPFDTPSAKVMLVLAALYASVILNGVSSVNKLETRFCIDSSL